MFPLVAGTRPLRKPLSSYVWARRCGDLTFAPLLSGWTGTNPCHRCHLQLEQTKPAATQLDTNAAGLEGRLEHRVQHQGCISMSADPGHLVWGYVWTRQCNPILSLELYNFADTFRKVTLHLFYYSRNTIQFIIGGRSR